MRAHPEPLRYLRNRLAPLGDLRHRTTLDLVAEIAFAQLGLLASKSWKKTPGNLGAVQSTVNQEPCQSKMISERQRSCAFLRRFLGIGEGLSQLFKRH